MESKSRLTLDKTRRELKNFVQRRVKDSMLAEDIVQDVLVKMHTRMGQLKDSEKMTGWMYQITRNAITDHFRSQLQSKSIHPSDVDWQSDPQELNECVIACMNGMLMTLPEKYRQALELAELENLSQVDLAKRLRISYSGAKSRVQRARQMLKDKMNESYVIKTDSYGNVIGCEDRGPCNCRSGHQINEEVMAG
jgi:RNA polymerase sigma-70 factor (ECF subfamily)